MTTTSDRLDNIERYLQGKLRRATEQLDTFKMKLTEDPGYAMEWADRNFAAAAEAHMSRQVLHNINQMQDIRDLPAHEILAHLTSTATREVMRSAQTVEASTSVSANHYKNHLRKAWADFLEVIQFD